MSDDTKISWKAAPGAARYRIWWRATTEPQWSHSKDAGAVTSVSVKDVVIDDWFFGVQAISADGWESPIEFPGPAGSFVSPPPIPVPAPVAGK